MHALGLYLDPPTHPVTRNCIMIVLKHDPTHVTEPERRFSFEDARVVPFSELLMEQPSFQGNVENRLAYDEQAQKVQPFSHTVLVLLTCEGVTNIKPLVTSLERIAAFKSQPLVPLNWREWLRKQISGQSSL